MRSLYVESLLNGLIDIEDMYIDDLRLQDLSGTSNNADRMGRNGLAWNAQMIWYQGYLCTNYR
jgi:hypothetical protein